MGGYQRLVQRLEARPASADGADARQLERWADEMGDVLESGYLRQADAERVIGRLVQWALRS
ncbi:hypothetical protein Stsp02_50460 [Streptomyces sp. NBRC 14336]|nr:hypothetical protein Stsp02_50460 [Streptomyces sp. NBRC 14336]